MTETLSVYRSTLDYHQHQSESRLEGRNQMDHKKRFMSLPEDPEIRSRGELPGLDRCLDWNYAVICNVLC